MKTNLNPNVASALCYLPFVGWIAAIIFLIVEKDDDVRFNAVQALILMGVLWVLYFVTAITIILPPLLGLAGLILQVVLAIKAYNKEKVELPVVGKWSRQILEKITAGTK